MATTGGALAARARADGVPVVPLPGGFQPRAAVGYALVTALEAAALSGAAPSVRDEVEAAAVLAEQLAVEWGPDGAEEGDAKRIARALHGSIPVIVGAGLTRRSPTAGRRQLNENAELPAFASELPEHDHNEVVGWGARRAPAVRRLPRGSAGRRAHGAPHRGDGGARGGGRRGGGARDRAGRDARWSALVSLVLLGDLVSLYRPSCAASIRRRRGDRHAEGAAGRPDARAARRAAAPQ